MATAPSHGREESIHDDTTLSLSIDEFSRVAKNTRSQLRFDVDWVFYRLDDIRARSVRLFGRIKGSEQDLEDPAWAEQEKKLLNLLKYSVSNPDTIGEGVSLQAKVINGKKCLKICLERDADEAIAKNIEMVKHLAEKWGFDNVRVLGRSLYRVGLPTQGLSVQPEPIEVAVRLASSSALGSRLDPINKKQMPTPIMTLGGVVLIDGRLYGLTTGHGASRIMEGELLATQAQELSQPDVQPSTPKSEDLDPQSPKEGLTPPSSLGILRGKEIGAVQWTQRFGRIGKRRYPGEEPLQQKRHFGMGADWAILEFDDDDIPPNMIFELHLPNKLLWPGEGMEEMVNYNLVQETVTATQLVQSLEKGIVHCLVVTSSSIIPGFIAVTTSSLILDGEKFDVFRIYTDDPFKYGDSGSWVLVRNALCGIIFVGIRGASTNEPISRSQEAAGGESSKRPEEEQIPGAYMIPIEDVFQSISTTLSATVCLPTLDDWRIWFLRSQRRAQRWSTPAARHPETWVPRQLELELYLAQKQSQNRERMGNGMEIVRLQSTAVGSCLAAIPRPKLGEFTRSILEEFSGLRCETLDHLLLLGEVCPLSSALRPGLKRWIKDYRKSRFHDQRTFASSVILERFIYTQAGENLLGMLLILWKTQRGSAQRTERPKAEDQSRRIAWLALLLSSLYGIMGVPVVVIPSMDQLQIFAYCVIAAFKDKDLNHLYLISDANDSGKALPSTNNWLTSPPSRPNLFRRRLARAVSWISGENEKEELLTVNRVLHTVTRDALWNHTVFYTSRLLVLMQRIATGGRTQVLVCGGSYCSWAGFYAAVVLGLEVESRQLNPDNALFGFTAPYGHLGNKDSRYNSSLSIPADVLLFPEGGDPTFWKGSSLRSRRWRKLLKEPEDPGEPFRAKRRNEGHPGAVMWPKDVMVVTLEAL
ncbi:hypothetical protein O1611_g5963 [Lasiodiplodia mahajangana]|uniref:Uncharacterized protein n=1 Tax=Lasiodiplodia mahajangana TaxID=1108764 RepID=A0ACC2JJG5_9PEZI|nr:hypothetical protein O1611_g5963 [Lasiodiplodia mahajangana]